MKTKQWKKQIMERLNECIYADFDMDSADENLKVINDKDNLQEIDNAIDIVNRFLNGDYNEY